MITDLPLDLHIVQQYYACLKARDRAGLVELLDPHIVITYHCEQGLLPWSGSFHGIAGFDAFFSTIKQYLEVIEVSIDSTMTDAGKVVNQCTGEWRFLKNYKVVSASMLNIFTLTGSQNNRKISGYDVYTDTASFVAKFPKY